RLDTGQSVDPVDVHRARAAHAFAAGAAKGQGRVDLVLDLDQRVQDHWAAVVEIDLESVDDRGFTVVRVPAVDLEPTRPRGARRPRDGFTDADPRVRRQGKLRHSGFSIDPRLGRESLHLVR